MNHSVAIIGGGPAGLMAAEVLSQQGVKVDVYDSMSSLGRKFLMAGKSGLNLTHSEPFEQFVARYGNRRARVESWLKDFSPDDLREWAHGLGIETFVGTSGRVFPVRMKASPLLRAWLKRLGDAGINFHLKHRWNGVINPAAEDGGGSNIKVDGGLRKVNIEFETLNGIKTIKADAVIMPGSLVVNMTENARAWMRSFNGSRIIIPDDATGVYWMNDLRQVAESVRALAEGQELRPQSASKITPVWTYVAYVFAALFAFQLLFMLLAFGVSMVSGF